METTPPASLKQHAVGDLEHELRLTRRMLERVPEEHLDWTPHEKSFSLGALAAHVANLPFWQTGVLKSDEFDLASAPPPAEPPAGHDALMDAFDRNAEALREAFAQTGDDALRREWTLRHGERVLDARPKAAALRRLGVSHMIHHRGQLTVYLRMLDMPVPPTYGPTADEDAGFEAS